MLEGPSLLDNCAGAGGVWGAHRTSPGRDLGAMVNEWWSLFFQNGRTCPCLTPLGAWSPLPAQPSATALLGGLWVPVRGGCCWPPCAPLQ